MKISAIKMTFLIVSLTAKIIIIGSMQPATLKRPLSGSMRIPQGTSKKQKITEIIATNADDMSYACSKCDARFKHSIALTSHMLTHSDDMSYACSKCDRVFKQKGHFASHMRVHLGAVILSNDHTVEKPFSCPYPGCTMSFKQKVHCTTHMKTHTGEKPFKCLVCGKSFAQSSNLNKHSKIHEKPFPCNKCTRAFDDNAGLIRHGQVHLKENDLKCVICKQCFSRRDSLILHVKTHQIEPRNFTPLNTINKILSCTVLPKDFITPVDVENTSSSSDNEVIVDLPQVVSNDPFAQLLKDVDKLPDFDETWFI